MSNISKLVIQQAIKNIISQGFVAIAAAHAAAEGKPLSEVMQIDREVRQRASFAATRETLEYLTYGGRIGEVAYMLGSLIQIKPILTLNDGVVTPLSRVRGENHALQAIVDYVARQVEGLRVLHLAVEVTFILRQFAPASNLNPSPV